MSLEQMPRRSKVRGAGLVYLVFLTLFDVSGFRCFSRNSRPSGAPARCCRQPSPPSTLPMTVRFFVSFPLALNSGKGRGRSRVLFSLSWKMCSCSTINLSSFFCSCYLFWLLILKSTNCVAGNCHAMPWHTTSCFGEGFVK